MFSVLQMWGRIPIEVSKFFIPKGTRSEINQHSIGLGSKRNMILTKQITNSVHLLTQI